MKHTRRRNINEPGHAHELTFSCYQGFPFLQAERTCQWLAESIGAARQKYDFALWAYVFMPNHVHLVVWPRRRDYDIAVIRKAIKAPVARRAIDYLAQHAPEWLPRITRRRGQKTERLLWQSGGGYDRNITSARTLLQIIDYIHANPVRKQLVLRPRDWKWSSAAWFDDLSEIPLLVDPIPSDWLEIA
jgi:putative transposase